MDRVVGASEEIRTHSWEDLTVFGSKTSPAVETVHPERHYLVVFQSDTSRMFELAPEREVLIGRVDVAPLRLNDPSVSRRHAIVTSTTDGFVISDLDSQNGTFVNGEQLTGLRRIDDGDEISIGIFTLVFHSSVRSAPRRRLLEADLVRQRTGEEIERALRYRRPLSVIVVQGLRGDAIARTALAEIVEALRLFDVVGWLAAERLAIILPEADAPSAALIARRILELLRSGERGPRLGVACYPADGADANALLAAALAAASGARVGELASASAATLEIGQHTIIVEDPAMIRVYELIRRLAASRLPVLISGETGTGKELAALALHVFSQRSTGPLITLNCATIQEALVEGELFGYEKGAFTGATASKPGLIEASSGGTLFLDEIGELSASTQAKLLRVLENGTFTRLGSVAERAVDLRIVAATNRDLEGEVQRGTFRQDLYFRLSGATVWLPPLRNRRRELPLLAQRFLAQACVRAGRPAMAISPQALMVLGQHSWPGNVRELRNTMEYVAAIANDAVLEPKHLEDRLPNAANHREPPVDEGTTPPPERVAGFQPVEDELRELERRRMAEALLATSGNQTRAAQLIRMPLRTFVAKAKQYGLREPSKPDG
ncbi:MAG: Sigma-54 dependent transcriptional regulator, Fis family [Deltaproteobacteria bacterium]|nr:Sigma-54 dependent transcriptional regulator, Fis family [Deltaproteobacteria bacterium]